jgi:hypothetical protein
MKTEWKVLASLVALLLLMEVGVRAFETRLSKDLAHLREMPEAAERLKEGDGNKILIVGNSLARHGIDRKLLAKGLENKGYGKVQVEAFNPDATGITEWYYGLRRYFLNRGAIPDRIVLVTGRTHLLDVPVVPERLGAFYVDRTDVKEAVLLDLRSVESAARFFLARVSGLFANRARIQPYIFYNYLPEYTQTIQEMNDQRKMMVEASELIVKQQTSALSRLLKVAQSNGIDVAVVAIPMRVPYELPKTVSDEIGDLGASLLDLSQIPGIAETNYFDGYHLDAEGARQVTVELKKLLVAQDRRNSSKEF